jgi:histone H4
MAPNHYQNVIGFFRSRTTAIAVLGTPANVPEDYSPEFNLQPGVRLRYTQTQDEGGPSNAGEQAPAPIVPEQAPAPIVVPQAPAPIVQAPAPEVVAAPIVQAPAPVVVQRFTPGSFGRGRGKGGKGIGKGGHKRHRKVLRDNIQGVTNGAIRRLARRGGVKRLSGLVYEETRNVLVDFVRKVIHDAVVYTEYAKRKTIVAMDVVLALKRQGRPIYGFGG